MTGPTSPESLKKTTVVTPTNQPVTEVQAHPPISAFSDSAVPAVNAEGSGTGAAVFGRSKASDGVHGESSGGGMSGVAGIHNSGGHGIYGKSSGVAGYFDGNVVMNGEAAITGSLTVEKDITFTGGDCAEQFDSLNGAAIEPGTLVVIDASGALKESAIAYDKKVIGVIAGAGHYRPAIVLDKGPVASTRVVVSLMGKAFCKVDATYGAIEVGDLLTSSPEPGHAMLADSRERSYGTVVGKALSSMQSGKGMIPILLALQ